MFAKKFLSLIGVLFVGSQFISTVRAVRATQAPGLPDCDGIRMQGEGSGYCISKGVIYEAFTDDSGKVDMSESSPISEGPGIYGFIVDLTNPTTNLATYNYFNNRFDPSGGYTNDQLNNFSFYDCTFDVVKKIDCTRTFGYINIGLNSYLEAGVNGNVKIESLENTECNIGSLYLDSGKNKLCIDGENGVELVTSDTDPVKNYFVKNVFGNIFYDTDSVEATDDNKKYIVVKASQNAFTLVDKDYDYCDGENGEAIETFKKICEGGVDGNPCGEGKSIYETVNGLIEIDNSCKMKIGNNGGVITVIEAVNCIPGYYLLDIENIRSDGYVHLASSGKLFECTTPDDCAIINDPTRGYYRNTGAESPTIAAYIACSGSPTCSVMNTESDCKKAGSIVYAEKTYKICLDKGETIPAIAITNGESGVKRFVSLDNDNVFGSANEGKYVSVNLVNGNVLADIVELGNIDRRRTTPNLQNYVYTDKQYLQQSKIDNPNKFLEAVCATGTFIVEFKMDASIDITNVNLLLYEKQGFHKWRE